MDHNEDHNQNPQSTYAFGDRSSGGRRRRRGETKLKTKQKRKLISFQLDKLISLKDLEVKILEWSERNSFQPGDFGRLSCSRIRSSLARNHF